MWSDESCPSRFEIQALSDQFEHMSFLTSFEYIDVRPVWMVTSSKCRNSDFEYKYTQSDGQYTNTF